MVMVGSSASVGARKRARDARIRVDADRVARDGRVEDAAAEFFTASGELTRTVARLELVMGRALVKLAGEGETVERIAAMCEISAADVRRLCKLGQPKRAHRAPADDATAGAGTDEDAAADRPDAA